MERRPSLIVTHVHVHMLLHQKLHHVQIVVDTCLKTVTCTSVHSDVWDLELAVHFQNVGSRLVGMHKNICQLSLFRQKGILIT